jgi:phage shock protein A
VSIFKRFGDLVRSNVNDALEKSEDPRKILEQTILDMQEEHKKARKMLLESITLLKQTEKQAVTYRETGTSWEQKAMAALKAGSDDLARTALAEKQKYDEMALEAENGVNAQKGQSENLKGQVTMLEQKIEEAKRKKDELIARLNNAEMTKKRAGIGSGTGNAVGDATAFDTFDRMVGKIENSEAEVEARRELQGMSGMGTTSEATFELDKKLKEAHAEDALAALKAKMSAASTPAAAPASPPAAADPKASAIEDELAALKKKLGG